MLKLFKTEMILIGCQCFYHSSFLCSNSYSCVLSALHLGCTHTSRSDLSTINPQSPVHFTSVSALRVSSAVRLTVSRLKRWLGCGTHVVISNHAEARNSPFNIFVCAIVIIITAKIVITTWISHFSNNVI